VSSGRRFGIYGQSLAVNADDSGPSNGARKAQLVRTDRNRETETETKAKQDRFGNNGNNRLGYMDSGCLLIYCRVAV